MVELVEILIIHGGSGGSGYINTSKIVNDGTAYDSTSNHVGDGIATLEYLGS